MGCQHPWEAHSSATGLLEEPDGGKKPLRCHVTLESLHSRRWEGNLTQSSLSSFVALRSCSEAVRQFKKNLHHGQSLINNFTVLEFFPPFSQSYLLSSVSFMVPLCCSQFSFRLNWWKKVLFCEGVWERKKKKKDTTVTLCILVLHKAVIHTTQHSAHTSGQKGFCIGNPPTLSWISELGVALLNNGQGGDFGGSGTCLG